MAKNNSWTPERRAKFGADMAARKAAKANQQKQTPQTKTVEEPTNVEIDNTPAEDLHRGYVETPIPPTAPQPAAPAIPGNLSFTPEQFEQLMAALAGGNTDRAPAPSLTGMQTNAQGQVVGIIEKYDSDVSHYPNPVDEITNWMNTDKRTRRFAFSDNYYLSWDVTTDPYPTKYGTNVQEPTFHLTLFANMYDDDGDDTDEFRVVQSFHFNEDEGTAFDIALSFDMRPTAENMKEVLDLARAERIRRWLLNIFFTEHNFDLNSFYSEQAIGGQVVKVITRSAVKGKKLPKADEDDLR